ncbi:F-box domain-containing protein [Heracleum sosnowskyi]|uniref:F-box domain-containing protein n=1 Tax=Heracleum sosnowskyi TaxID=360622 RepID=A0AAD8HTI0_9APIA|nr:F-box domain-containing protein [Heracleum sosnowskyi]
MSLSKHKKMPSYDIPEELLSEIFKRLPVKYVLRCRAVQKSWYHFLKTPLFITLHCNYQKMTAHINPKYLLIHNTDTHLLTVCTDDVQCQEYCTLEYPLDFDNHEWYALSNGLVCVSSVLCRRPGYDSSIYLWNPLLQKCRTLPDSPLSRFTIEEFQWKALAFGFLPEVNDYVVVHVGRLGPDLPDPNELEPAVMIGVYSLNTNSWKEFYLDAIINGCISRQISSDKPVFVGSTAYWIANEFSGFYQAVMYWDTKTNTLGEINVPILNMNPDRLFDDPLIHQFGQSIAYFIEDDDSHHLDIWVLKDDPIQKFYWEKKVSVILCENVWADVLGIRNSGEPILAKLNNLISYDIDTWEPYDFIDSCDRLTPNSNHEEGSKPPFVITPFVETLLWFDLD